MNLESPPLPIISELRMRKRGGVLHRVGVKTENTQEFGGGLQNKNRKKIMIFFLDYIRIFLTSHIIKLSYIKNNFLNIFENILFHLIIRYK